MSNFYRRVITKKSCSDLIKPEMVIECRRYYPRNNCWTVTSWSGWPMDSERVKVVRGSKNTVRFLVNEFLTC